MPYIAVLLTLSQSVIFLNFLQLEIGYKISFTNIRLNESIKSVFTIVNVRTKYSLSQKRKKDEMF